jgi:hypothetical protein
MTESATNTFEFTVTDIVTQAARRAGILAIEQSLHDSPQLASHARDLFETTVDHLSAEGIFEKVIQYYDLQLTAGVNVYPLDPDVLTPVGNGQYYAPGDLPGNSTSETLVQQISGSEYHALSAKGARARPTLFFTERLATVSVYIWPTPDQDGSIRFRAHKLYADVQDGNATPPVQRFWAEYFVWEVAHKLAVDSSLDIQRCGYLRGEAARKLTACRNYANEHETPHTPLYHPTQWSNR